MSNLSEECKNLSATKARQCWISELSLAESGHLRALWNDLNVTPQFEFLRKPEIGAVMTRARIGGDGGPFNLGEATVTRCSVRLDTGEEGHAYALGRDKQKAEISALCDALLQTAAAERVQAGVIAPLAEQRAARSDVAARKAAATKVEFFTMTRGDD